MEAFSPKGERELRNVGTFTKPFTRGKEGETCLFVSRRATANKQAVVCHMQAIRHCDLRAEAPQQYAREVQPYGQQC